MESEIEKSNQKSNQDEKANQESLDAEQVFDKKHVVSAQNVAKVYETKSSRVEALKDVTLRISQGERVALLGRSGSGKSTLLNLLSGMDRPTSGTIAIGEQTISQADSDALATFRQSSVGVVYQAFHLLPNKSAIENVEMPCIFAGIDRKTRRERAKQTLRKVGLADRETHLPSQLSGGEQQRVAIARAMINTPPLLLADEPTGNLDTQTAGDIVSLMIEYSERNQVAMLLVTHDEELAESFSHRTVRMVDGRLV